MKSFMNLDVSLKLLAIVGCDPNKVNNLSQVCQYLLAVGCCILLILLSILNLVFSTNKIGVEDVANVLTISTTFIFCITKMTTMFAQKNKVTDMLNKMEYIFWDIEHISNIEEQKRYSRRLKNAQTIFYIRFFLALLWFVNMFSISHIPMPVYRPSWCPIIVIIIFEDITLTILYVVSFSSDGLIMATLVMTRIQFEMLNAKMRIIFEVDRSNDDVISINERIKKWVWHHNFLLKFTRLINDSYSWSMLVYLGNVTGFLCAYMYHFTVMSASDHISIVDIMVIVLLLFGFTTCYAIPAQECIDEAYKIKTTTYLTNWYSHPEHTKSLLMIMARDQLEVLISAGGYIHLNVETFSKVIRSALSYYLFLRTATMIDKE